jgi:hypothetical protein
MYEYGVHSAYVLTIMPIRVIGPDHGPINRPIDNSRKKTKESDCVTLSET